jgi:membrane-associated phospholipid phosphatase
MAVAYQRVDSGAHFLSDVLCGAAVACVVAAIGLRAGMFRRQPIEIALERVREFFFRSETVRRTATDTTPR